ncbi:MULTISPECIES: pyridoxamine 5'-phosphate oxidase family protein [Marinobacter]|uniref:nitric oxide dioxygenase n=1 Tax=Marinobacter profundi TaxID=2666256 RepID=A0A2G1UQH1_9GAMM|nr:MULTISPECIES: pyridoxamine 5'-phosphate oxidase family protein [Marinobacter]MBD3655702.1 pyridoxamine 5'-phosphate oxidase family protein [Marinobacter sp.]PHQ16757.1 ferredoxin [Marinobacter profundi]
MQTPHWHSDDASPFHHGEQAVQRRLGVRDSIEPWARQVVRAFLPDQHREFFKQLPFVVAAARDATGRPWVTLLTGAPGFVSTPDPTSLHIAARVLPGDALEGALTAGAELGLLGIELHTRRRNRVNGTIDAVGINGLTLTVGQCFGNCPQYITERSWHQVDVKPGDASATHYQRLTRGMQAWIGSATTLFIGSGYRGKGRHAGYGMDASHRGGAPGFVAVPDDRQLILPDYSGNNHFNTIGNLVADPRVALLFVDFEKGSLLQISGKATIDWDSAEIARHPGAQRLVAIDIEQIVQLDGVLPLRWSAPEPLYSLRLVKKTKQSEDVTSFEFVAQDDAELANFMPGQHLPIELHIEGHAQPIKRTYSLSNAPGEGRYRISVKREPHGTVSRYLHDKLIVGDIVNAQKPEGDFVLAPGERPVALVSAGVGVTPMVSMLQAMAREAGERPVYFIHGVRNGSHHPFADEVRALAKRHPKVHVNTVYSQPRNSDRQGRDYDHRGHIGIDLLTAMVPALDADFYLCGPSGFLADTVAALSESGVESDRIHTETF